MQVSFADSKESLVPDDPSHDVIKKCKNGRLHRPVDDIYIIFMLDLEKKDDPDGTPIAYSYEPDFSTSFIEQIASKYLYGSFWDTDKKGSPCFDPVGDDGEPRPLPKGQFMMWDVSSEDDVDAQGLPSPAMPCLTIYSAEPERRPIRKYKTAKLQLTINDLMSIETEGDTFFTR